MDVEEGLPLFGYGDPGEYAAEAGVAGVAGAGVAAVISDGVGDEQRYAPRGLDPLASGLEQTMARAFAVRIPRRPLAFQSASSCLSCSSLWERYRIHALGGRGMVPFRLLLLPPAGLAAADDEIEGKGIAEVLRLSSASASASERDWKGSCDDIVRGCVRV